VSRLQRTLERVRAGIAAVEDALLALLLTALIVLATLQIGLRNFFDSGVVWIGPLLRYLVLWLGLLGALAATRTGEQIAIDAISRVLPGRLRALGSAATLAFTAGVCGLLAYYGVGLVRIDREAESIAFEGIPTWIFACVIPLCFAGMALRYGIGCLSQLPAVVRPGPSDAHAASPADEGRA